VSADVSEDEESFDEEIGGHIKVPQKVKNVPWAKVMNATLFLHRLRSEILSRIKCRKSIQSVKSRLQRYCLKLKHLSTIYRREL
jgi:hypothetical protein